MIVASVIKVVFSPTKLTQFWDTRWGQCLYMFVVRSNPKAYPNPYNLWHRNKIFPHEINMDAGDSNWFMSSRVPTTNILGFSGFTRRLLLHHHSKTLCIDPLLCAVTSFPCKVYKYKANVHIKRVASQISLKII
jgi:hypothetical protein